MPKFAPANRWMHSICLKCWTERNPNRTPIRIVGAEFERCCFCGYIRNDGIYVRMNPDTIRCKAVHESPVTSH